MTKEHVGYMESRLAHIEERSEQLFLSLGEGFPQLLSELRDDIADSARHLDVLIDAAGSDGGVDGRLSSLWGRTHGVLADASTYFATLATRDEAVFSALRSGIERLSVLRGHIDGLREDALDMEVLAINAVVAARRAGESGKGFAYVANELKLLAAGTVSDTDNLAVDGEVALQSLRRFSDLVEEIAVFQEQFFGEFEEELGKGFGDLETSIRELAVCLTGAVEEARGVERPLRRIMEEIQIQDIIMQSIAHVILVAEHAQADGTVVTDGGVRRSMENLSGELLTDIRERVTRSRDVFAENLAALHTILDSIHNACRERRIAGGTGVATSEGIEAAFAEPIGLLHQITDGISRTNGHRATLRDHGVSITTQLDDVMDRLTSISQSTGKLYPIKILSRVEIAKQASLETNSGSIDEIANFAQKVHDHVGGSIADVTAGLAQIEKVVGDYSTSSGGEITASEVLSNDIESAASELELACRKLTGGLEEFSVFSARSYELLAKSERDVTGIGELITEIDELISELGQTSPTPAHLPTGGDDRMKGMVEHLVEQFTIARHKVAAASLAGIDVDDGGSEGELTLF